MGTRTTTEALSGEDGFYENRPAGKLMPVAELGETLGLKKTERYRLMHMGLFETTMFLGRLWAVRESFEKWYANQVRYHKVNGEEPGRELREWSYSVRDMARILGLHEATAYEILKRDQIKTVEVDHCRRIPKDIFDSWYAGQDKYRMAEPGPEDADRKAYMKNQSLAKPVNGEFITIEEAAFVSGFSRTTISKWAQKGYFTTGRTGRGIMVRKEELEQYLRDRKSAGKGGESWPQ